MLKLNEPEVLTPRAFCAEIVSEPTYFKSDVFIRYEQILKLALDEKAVIYTRRSGCEFETSPKFADWDENISYYKVTRIADLQTPLCPDFQISVEKCTYAQAIEWLTDIIIITLARKM